MLYLDAWQGSEYASGMNKWCKVFKNGPSKIWERKPR